MTEVKISNNGTYRKIWLKLIRKLENFGSNEPCPRKICASNLVEVKCQTM